MELHPHTRPIRDPFFAALRRRRPDVDIVLLPPERPTPQPDPVDDAQVGATLERVTDQMTHLWQAVAGADGDRPRIRLGYGPDVGTVVASARGTTGVDDGFRRLVRLRHELESGGWRVGRLAGASERLTGRHHDLRVHASYAEDTGSLVVELVSEPLPVGVGRARSLVRSA